MMTPFCPELLQRSRFRFSWGDEATQAGKEIMKASVLRSKCEWKCVLIWWRYWNVKILVPSYFLQYSTSKRTTRIIWVLILLDLYPIVTSHTFVQSACFDTNILITSKVHCLKQNSIVLFLCYFCSLFIYLFYHYSKERFLLCF